jgi:hypothetical protein
MEEITMKPSSDNLIINHIICRSARSFMNDYPLRVEKLKALPANLFSLTEMLRIRCGTLNMEKA